MKVLFLCTDSPFPSTSGAALRTSGWMRAIQPRCSVGLVTLARGRSEELALEAPSGIDGPCSVIAARRNHWRRGRDLLRAVLRREPYLLTAANERRMRQAVARTVRGWRPDLVQAELLPATRYLDLPRALGLPTIYSAHNVESRLLVGAGGPFESCRASRMEGAEARARAEADTVVAVSEIEACQARRQAARVLVVPNAIHAGDYTYRGPSDRAGGPVFFAGHLRYPPNVDACRILAHGVLPRLRRHRPDLRCVLAGRSPTRGARRLAAAGVEVVADAADLTPRWQEAGLFVCPLRRGAGSRLKLLEAAAWGVPIVATPFSLEGLALESGRDCLTARDEEGLAEQAARLLDDLPLAERLARQARRTVERFHDWPGLVEPILELYEDLSRHHRQE